MKQLALALALVVGTAFAQDTESCRALFESLQVPPDQEMLADLHSLTMTMTMTQALEGETMNVTTRSVMDFDNARMYQETDLGDGNQMVIRYQDGAASMNMMGMDMPAPPGMAEMLEAQLEQMMSGMFNDPASVAPDSELVSCDGAQDYGVLAGEQITVSLSQPAAFMQEMMAGNTTSYVFVDGEAKGIVQTMPEFGTTIMVIEELQRDGSGWPTHMTMRTYAWDGTSATESGLMTLSFSYNEPVDEALFAP
jgi:hypothetical protein